MKPIGITCKPSEVERFRSDQAYAREIRDAALDLANEEGVPVGILHPDGTPIEVVQPTSICSECGCVIDKTRPGHGHRYSPICGNYTWEINPAFKKFVTEFTNRFSKTNGREPSPAELLAAWIEKS